MPNIKKKNENQNHEQLEFDFSDEQVLNNKIPKKNFDEHLCEMMIQMLNAEDIIEQVASFFETNRQCSSNATLILCRETLYEQHRMIKVMNEALNSFLTGEEDVRTYARKFLGVLSRNEDDEECII